MTKALKVHWGPCQGRVRRMRLKSMKKMNEEFLHCQRAGIGVSATLIVLSSSLLAWVYSARFGILTASEILFFVFSITFLSSAILLAVFMQYFNYRGLLHRTNSLIEGTSDQGKAKRLFEWANRTVNIGFTTFILGVISAIIFWALNV